MSDLILLVPRGGHGALCIEMKIDSRGSRQSEARSEWGLPIPVEESHDTAKVSVPSSKEEVVMEVAFLPDELVFVTQRLLKLGENVSEGLLNLLGYVPES